MIDPLAEVVALLRPGAPAAKVSQGAGAWRVRREGDDRPFYCAVLEGRIRLTADDGASVVLAAGDFVLIPAAADFTATSPEPPPGTADTPHVWGDDGVIRHGDLDAAPDFRLAVGFCAFASPDAALLVPLLPRMAIVRGEPRLAVLMGLLRDELRAQRPARDAVLARLLEILLIEALRSASDPLASAGLARGLADERLAIALRAIHAEPARAWTVAALAREAALSRTAFFERFAAFVGVAPMAYLLAWRMALAKDLLRRGGLGVAEVAERVGYGSASTFSVAFARHVGRPPLRWARGEREALPTG